MREQVSIFHTALSFDMALFLAFVVNIPALVIFVVKVETAFYEKFVVYISVLNNGTLHMIEKERNVMTRALLQEPFFVYEVQLIINVVLVCLVSGCFLLPLPLLVGGLSGWLAAYVLLRRRMNKLDSFLMC